MKNLLVVLFFMLVTTLSFAEGGKNNNPLNAATLDDGCVLVFADGIDEEKCIEVDSPVQSGQQFICQVLVVCGTDD